MNDTEVKQCIDMDGCRRISLGPIHEVALTVKAVVEGGAAGPVLTFDYTTGRVVDLGIRGIKEDVVARVRSSLSTGKEIEEPRGPGASQDPRVPGRSPTEPCTRPCILFSETSVSTGRVVDISESTLPVAGR